MKGQPLTERFDDKVLIPHSMRGWWELCWTWKGGVLSDGYGAFWMDGMNRRAHRIAFEIYHGPIPEDTCVLHTCDNRLCVNPDHLFLGTRADNIKDATKKGRQQKGETHYNAKLTETDVRMICTLYNRDKWSHKDIAERFGVHPVTISDIINGRTWRSVI